MQRTPPKLRKRAKTSNELSLSPRKAQPRMAAQNGALLKSVFWTIKGTIAVPKARHVKPIVPRTLLKSNTTLS